MSFKNRNRRAYYGNFKHLCLLLIPDIWLEVMTIWESVVSRNMAFSAAFILHLMIIEQSDGCTSLYYNLDPS